MPIQTNSHTPAYTWNNPHDSVVRRNKTQTPFDKTALLASQLVCSLSFTVWFKSKKKQILLHSQSDVQNNGYKNVHNSHANLWVMVQSILLLLGVFYQLQCGTSSGFLHIPSLGSQKVPRGHSNIKGSYCG